MASLFAVISTLVLLSSVSARWPAEKAEKWALSRGYQAGVNFIPSNAINQLEMFQSQSYDPITIDRELGYAQSVGFNTLRVFLHNILWDEGPQDLLKRLDGFLTISSNRGFSTMFVLFDSCWNAYPKAGEQPAATPGVHNSQWVQCPGHDLLQSPEAFNQLKPYVQGVVSHFQNDSRVLAWDVWNEPNNSGYSDELIAPLLTAAFEWIREVRPSQPLTTPIWQDVERAVYTSFQELQLQLSDVLSFHNYEPAAQLSQAIARVRATDAKRPIICTEYMARTEGSTFEPNLQVLKDAGVIAYNWGLVSGRTQTIYPWSSLQEPFTEEPAVWFHDILRADGAAFNQSEVTYIQSILLKR